MNQALYRADLRAFYRENFIKITGYGNIKNKEIRKFVEENFETDSSHIRRITVNIQRLKYSYLIPKTMYIATCVKATYKNTSCIIGFLYSQYNKQAPGHIENTFVSLGGSFKSQDGEYRQRVHPWENFLKIYDRHKQYFERVELYVLSKLTAEQLEFHTDFCFPMDFVHNEKLMTNMIESTRVFIKMFVLCMFADFGRVHNKLIENHINPAYQFVIHQLEFLPIYQELIGELTKNGYLAIVYSIDKFGAVDSAVPNIYVMPECGQKIIPITIFEAIKNDNVTMSVWREMYLTNLCSNLVLNLISPSFSFVINWFYIQNSHPGIFDNLAMHDKYKYSDIAKQIANSLREANRLNFIDGDQRRGPIDGKFIKLAKIIQNANKYIDTSLKLTELSVCMLSEYVDRTIRDMPVLATESDAIMKFFTSEPHFHKHVFEFIYAFYNMNTKIGIFHGDLHLNNATYNRFYSQFTVKNPHIMYNIESSFYVFPHDGAFSSIIDFSRAVIGNRDRLVHDFSELDADEYFKSQRARIIQLIYHYFPTFIDKHRATIESLLIDKFELMFKLLTAIDTYTLASNLSALFVLDPAFKDGRIVVPQNITKFLIRLAQTAEALIVSNLRDVIDGKIKKPSDIEWPNNTIIKTMFESYLFQNYTRINKEKFPICDYFSSENEIIYDIQDTANWGPLLALDKQLQLAKKYEIDISDYEKAIREMERDETEKIEYLMSQYRREEKDLTKIESWMLV